MTTATKGCVLCLDDEPHVLRALQWLLQKDFEVHTSDNAPDALRLLGRHDFDVVVSDQRMPGITGVEFLRHVRKLAPRAMRILLTGYSDLDAMVRSVNESEVYRFVTKPWDVRTLPKLVEEAARVAREGPVVDETQGEPGARTNRAPLAAAPAQSPPQLLIIDDSPELHKELAAALKGTVQVLHASNLAGALTLLNERSIGVIMSEVHVGGMDATRLVRMMKRSHPEIISLVLSSHQDAQVVMSLINQGQVYRIIPKPVKPVLVKVLVESALRRHRQLVSTPSLARRFTVEATTEDTAESLLRDIVAAGTPRTPAYVYGGASHAPSNVAPIRGSAPHAAAGVREAAETAPANEGFVTGLFRRLFGG